LLFWVKDKNFQVRAEVMVEEELFDGNFVIVLLD